MATELTAPGAPPLAEALTATFQLIRGRIRTN
jgi:hypothetical protein